MSAAAVHIARTDDLPAVRRLGIDCGLDDSAPGDEVIEAAWGAFIEGRLVGAVVLESRHGRGMVNWMAVDAACRHRGIGGRLCAALEREALARGIVRLWVTARAPAFFLARGYEAVTDGRERDALLEHCRDCAQFGRGCEPQALTKRIDDLGPPDGPRSEGEMCRDRD